jgi:hypothetical protein
MFNISSHEENVDQKNTEIPSHSSQNSYHQENNKCWQGCKKKGSLYTGWECKLVQPLWKSVWRM